MAFIAGVWAAFVFLANPGQVAYRPDGLYYTDMALRFAGVPAAEAAGHTLSWYAQVGIHVQPSYLDPTLNHDWLLVAPRVVYPLLSAPFVRLFGFPGMLVVPVLCLLLTAEIVLVVGARLAGSAAACTAALLIMLSSFIVAWATSDITDGVAMGAAAVLTAMLVVAPRPAPRHWLVGIAVVVLLFSFTRQVGPISVGLVAVPWLVAAWRARRLRNEWLPATVATTVTALACTAFTLWWAPFPLDEEMTRATGYSGLTEAVLNFPGTVLRLEANEVTRMLSHDHALVVLLGLAVLVILRRGSMVGAMALGGWLGALLLAGINGTLATDFRYFLPVVAPIALSAAIGLGALADRNSRIVGVRPGSHDSTGRDPGAALLA